MPKSSLPMPVSAPAPAPRGQRGFTLVELLVALVVMAEILIIAFILFDANNRLSRVQTQVADMQQSLRIGQQDVIRLVRMTGRGGLPLQDAAAPLPTGISLELQNNVADGTRVVPANNATPLIMEGTDVLTVRGVFNNPIYNVTWTEGEGGAATFVPPDTNGDGSVQICYQTRTGWNQDLSGLLQLLDNSQTGYPRREAIMLVSPVNDQIYAVAELDPTRSATDAPACPEVTIAGVQETGVTLGFTVDGGTYTTEYNELTPGGAFPAEMQGANGVAYLGILEEYRIYVREGRAIPGDDTSTLIPVLSRARFYPNTQQSYDANSMALDIAEHIIDFQVALGIDVNGDGQVVEDPDARDNPATDEWLNNAPNDPALAGEAVYLRLTTVARTAGLDPRYEAPDVDQIEDRVYSTTAPDDPLNGDDGRLRRRRTHTTVVALRNYFQMT